MMKKILLLLAILSVNVLIAQEISNNQSTIKIKAVNPSSISILQNLNSINGVKAPAGYIEQYLANKESMKSNKTNAAQKTYFLDFLVEAATFNNAGYIVPFCFLWPDSTIGVNNGPGWQDPNGGNIGSYMEHGSRLFAGGQGSYNYYPIAGYRAFGQILDPTSTIWNENGNITSGDVPFGKDIETIVDSAATSVLYVRGLDSTSGSKATGQIIILNHDSLAGDTIKIDNVAFVAGVNFNSDSINSKTADSLKVAINNSSLNTILVATRTDSIITLTALSAGTAGNAISLSYIDTGAGIGAALSDTLLAGGINKTQIVDTVTLYLFDYDGLLQNSEGQSYFPVDSINHTLDRASAIASKSYFLTPTDTYTVTGSGQTATLNLKRLGFKFPSAQTLAPGEHLGIAIEYKPGHTYNSRDTMYTISASTYPKQATKLGNVVMAYVGDEVNSGPTVSLTHDDYTTSNWGQWVNNFIYVSGFNTSSFTSGDQNTTNGVLNRHMSIGWNMSPVGAFYTYAKGSSTGNNCRTVTFTENSNVTGTYTWDFGDGTPTSSDQNPVHTYEPGATNPTKYTVKLTVNTGTKNYIHEEEVSVNWCTSVGIESTGINAAISLYPNPANENVKVTYNGTSTQDVNLVLTNLQGQIVYNQMFFNTSNIDELINVSNLANGMYILKIQNAEGVFTQQIDVSK